VWARRHKLLVASALLIGVMLMPVRVQSQIPSPCCVTLSIALGTINTTLNNVVGAGLNAIGGVLTSIRDFERTVVWPAAAIAEARGLVGSLQGLYGQIRVLFTLPVASATLANPRILETILLSRNPSQIGTATAAYNSVYGSVPLAQNASPEVRDVVDMTDAAAQAAMKRAIAIDALADQLLQAADQINTSIQNGAPGSTPIIEAQAGAWLVRAQAYSQSAMADLMRVRAVDLANSGAVMKFGSSTTAGAQQDVQQLLKRR
jgi:hypothetical protein